MSWSNVPVQHALALVHLIVGQVRRGKDFMAAVHGGEGSGKSTTAKNLARAVAKILGVEVTVIFSMDQLLDVLAKGKKRQIYILDEAINVFHNQDWSTWEAKLLTKIVRQMRIMECVWILCVPDFEGLHPYLRDYRIWCRLYHPPVWKDDGLGNGPARILWRQERFDYDTQRVVARWHDAGDWISHGLDDDPEHRQYERDKVDNFNRLVKTMIDRRSTEEAKKNPKKKKPRQPAANRPAPPTTT